MLIDFLVFSVMFLLLSIGVLLIESGLSCKVSKYWCSKSGSIDVVNLIGLVGIDVVGLLFLVDISVMSSSMVLMSGGVLISLIGFILLF